MNPLLWLPHHQMLGVTVNYLDAFAQLTLMNKSAANIAAPFFLLPSL